MKLQKVTAVSALVIAAMGVGAGTSYADPLSPPSALTLGYHISPGADGRSVETVLDSGVFKLAALRDFVDVVDNTGVTVERIPLVYAVNGAVYPISPAIDSGSRRLTLTPAVPGAGVLTLHAVDGGDTAYGNMIRQVEIGWTKGAAPATIGVGIGAVVGCLLFLVSACIPGAAIGGAIGGYTGLNGANPALEPAIFDYIRTRN